jgi:ankyrin repeat protein
VPDPVRNKNVNSKAATGITALILAAMNRHPDVARELLEAKADQNARTTDGKTALIASREQAEVRTLLLQPGAKQ